MNYSDSDKVTFWKLIYLAFVILISPHSNAKDIPLSASLTKLFPNASHINKEDETLEIIPVYRSNILEGYAFHTAEIYPVRGYGGKPIDILVGLSSQGLYTGFVTLEHHEPIFIKDDGPQRLERYMAQLIGVAASDNIYIQKNSKKTLMGGRKSTYIDGITSATVTIKALNKTITKAARAVAQAKELEGFSLSSWYTPKTDIFENLTLEQLINRELVIHWPIYASQIRSAKVDKKLGYPSQPISTENEEPLAELYMAYLSHPLVEKNLLSGSKYEEFIKKNDSKDQYILVLSKGSWEGGSLSEKLSMSQRGAEVIRKVSDLKITNNDLSITDNDWSELSVFKIPPVAKFSPLSRTNLQFNADKKIKLNEVYQLPEAFFTQHKKEVETDLPLWIEIWQQRQNDISLLLLGLTILTIIFLNQHVFVKNSTFFHRVRWLYLSFTCLFIGFYSQGQLSIVNVLTLQHLLIDGSSIGLFLLDPIISILWCYVLISLVLFGRGVFCGWLCPFGAIQEFAGLLGKNFNINKWKIGNVSHNRLQKFKYFILGAIVFISFFFLNIAEQIAEVEPFKTSITLYFIREWYYVLYAGGIIFLAMKVHKFYCRYICPLGAFMAIAGAFPIFNWLTRRAECGSPCQNCRVNCEIDAIPKHGVIDMKECIQCLECIVINYNPTLCAIEVANTKKRNRVSAKYIPVSLVE